MNRYLVYIINTVLQYHSPDIWKCASINKVFENLRQGYKNLLGA